ncbi:MAG TPA: hypothetical protein VGJ15_02890 [Pirellulales bacterium]|jgi:hypothetical protein
MPNPLPHPLDVPNYDAPLVPARMGANSLPGLRRVHFGLGLVLINAWLMLAVSVVGILNPILIAVSNGSVLGVLWSVQYVSLTALFANFAGKTICLSAPKEIEGRTYLYTCFVYMLIAVGITLTTLVWTVLPGFAMSIGPPAQLLSTIFFVLFLRELANFLEAPPLVGRATTVVILTIVGFIFSLGQLVLRFQFAGGFQPSRGAAPAGQANVLPTIQTALSIVSFIYSVVVLFVTIKYLILLIRLRGRLRNCWMPMS